LLFSGKYDTISAEENKMFQVADHLLKHDQNTWKVSNPMIHIHLLKLLK